MQPAHSSRLKAFTLIELIAVMVVLAVLAAVAVPKYFDYRQRAIVTTSAAQFKTLARAGQQLFMTTGAWPPDWNLGVFPPAFTPYLDASFMNTPPAIGGTWDYNFYGTAALPRPNWSAHNSPASDTTLQQIDEIIDDGNIPTGMFGKITDAGYNVPRIYLWNPLP